MSFTPFDPLKSLEKHLGNFDFNSRVPFYNDSSDYTTNAPSYYDDLARKNKLIKHLALRIWNYDEELKKRFEAWDKNLEEFDDEVLRLLQEWMDNGRFEEIINEHIFGKLNDRVTEVEYKTPWCYVKPGDDIQSKLNSFPKGCKVFFLPGQYDIDESIIINKTMSLYGQGEVTINEVGNIETGLFTFENAPGSSIDNFTFNGNEKLAGWIGSELSFKTGILISDSDNFKSENINIYNKTYGITLDNCNYSITEKCIIIGFLTSGDIASTKTNFSSGVRVRGGTGHKIENVYVRYMGQYTTVGSIATDSVITNGIGEDLMDNGVYISSGESISISGMKFKNILSSGIKTRGNNHHVYDNNVTNAYIGISSSGNNEELDEQGYLGHGTIISNNNLIDCYRMGISVVGINAGYTRDNIVTGNYLSNCGEPGSNYPAIRTFRTKGHHIKNNIIEGTPCTFGILVAGISGEEADHIICENNTIRGNGATPTEGIRVLETKNSVFRGNIFENLNDTLSYGINGRHVKDSLFSGNIYFGGLVVRLESRFPSTGCITTGSFGANIGGHEDDENININNNGSIKDIFLTIDVKPDYVGQLARIGQELYIAVDTQSPDNWKKIINSLEKVILSTIDENPDYVGQLARIGQDLYIAVNTKSPNNWIKITNDNSL